MVRISAHSLQSLLYLALTCLGLAGCGVRAVPASHFVGSFGVGTHIHQPGQDDTQQVISMIHYTGIRNLREAGTQGGLDVHAATGAKICKVADADIKTAIGNYEKLAAAGALLAIEGPNEPNNWPVTYAGQTSGYTTTFMPVALFQSDLYFAAKSNPKLAAYPVFASSEAGGAEPDNVGLQFLTIPVGANILMPDGTHYADFVNTHNYLIANHQTAIVDNNAWFAENPGFPTNGAWDTPWGEYGNTWHKHFAGYAPDDLLKLPRVTTETGWQTVGPNSITEDQQGKLFLNLYCAAFKRGWAYTFIYMLHDSATQGSWGLFHLDYTPKLSATYIHNLTTILADSGTLSKPGRLKYKIPNQPDTVHDLLLQKSDGTFELIVWSELAAGTNTVDVKFSIFSKKHVTIYDPTIDTSPTQTLPNVSTVPLTLSDHPVILEIRPAGYVPEVIAGPVKVPPGTANQAGEVKKER